MRSVFSGVFNMGPTHDIYYQAYELCPKYSSIPYRMHGSESAGVADDDIVGGRFNCFHSRLLVTDLSSSASPR